MKKFNYAYLCPSAALERFEVWFNYLNIMKLRIMLQNYWCGKRGKAAVNKPTGSGESFIGFKLCEAHPDSRVCWLSPSSYIFDTQIENLRCSTDGYVPENIFFFTYAKLMLLSKNEVQAIQPDFIILAHEDIPVSCITESGYHLGQ